LAYDLFFLTSSQGDLAKLIRHNPALAVALIVEHLPAIVRDPNSAGEKKKGDLSHVRAYGFSFRGVVYRVVFAVDDSQHSVTIIAIGLHDDAYRRSRGR
jgi:mRNA-degrading endonuclease RelE of RelBE toxin-antitoxin system